MQKLKPTIVIGYSLESAVVARKLANDGYDIVFARSGEFGHLIDDIHALLPSSSYEKLIETEVDCTFESIYGSTYIHVPYDDLKIVNDANGLISYPFNQLSFGTAEEWEELKNINDKLQVIKLKAKTANNFMNIHKKTLPKWMYESVIHNMTLNKWKLKHSQLTKDGIYSDINFRELLQSHPSVMYYPKGGYKHLIEKLLDHSNITVKYVDLDTIKSAIRKQHRDKYFLIMDNRIDYIMDYMAGKLDRISIQVDDAKKDGMEEYMCVDNGFIITPSKDYWMTSSFDDIVKLVYSDFNESIGKQCHGHLIPTINNTKILSEYQKIIQRFPNKQFILPSSLTFGI